MPYLSHAPASTSRPLSDVEVILQLIDAALTDDPPPADPPPVDTPGAAYVPPVAASPCPAVPRGAPLPPPRGTGPAVPVRNRKDLSC